ncbi:hypothetical protein ACFRJ9_09925 [Paenarthrobacter sp. NPDC056912]|uniref:hypothetical protein n=1 Tax=Paenarthrobacter sp. NPDC056912 TaxID=3345965 RepID=UPI00366F2D6B
MKDHVHERLGFSEIDEQGNAVRAVSPHAPEPVENPRKRATINPFIVALWVLDAALVWFCLWAFAETMQPSGPTLGQSLPINFVVLSSVPYVLLGAILITAGLLLWHAVQWQNRRSRG